MRRSVVPSPHDGLFQAVSKRKRDCSLIFFQAKTGR